EARAAMCGTRRGAGVLSSRDARTSVGHRPPPPRSPMRSVPRSLRAVLLIVVCAVPLLGCTGATPEPGEYGTVNDKGEGYYGNFMFGCTGVLPTDGEYVDVTLENPDFCTCVFRGLKETVNFDEMKEFEEAQADAEPGELEIPKNIDSVRKKCAESDTAFD